MPSINKHVVPLQNGAFDSRQTHPPNTWVLPRSYPPQEEPKTKKCHQWKSKLQVI